MKSSGVVLIILVIWSILPLAHFIPMILSFAYANFETVSGSKFLPVLLGTLYKIIGRDIESAIAEKWSTNEC